jgi:nucleoside-diphosphate-sugar epimerase
MKVLLLGGTGNISTSIVRRLIEQQHEVVCFNRGTTGNTPPGVRVILGDRHHKEQFIQTMKQEKFDVVVDMISFSAEDAHTCIEAFRGVKQFIQCSTVCTYGIDYDWLPVSEDHPLRPFTGYGKGKAAADHVLLGAYYTEGFPVTIIKPSTTYGPAIGMLRQVAWDFSWIDRVKKGKPILICGDGNAIHSFLHVDDAAKGFVGVMGKSHCIGQTYNLVPRGFVTWEQYHQTAMNILNRQVELVSIPLRTLHTLEHGRFDICKEIFAHHVYYSAEKLFRDVPEFQPTISLEQGMSQVLAHMESVGNIPNSDEQTWEDDLIGKLKS